MHTEGSELLCELTCDETNALLFDALLDAVPELDCVKELLMELSVELTTELREEELPEPSNRHSDEQPSPSFLFLSSHCSRPAMTMPSPQTGRHMPPTGSIAGTTGEAGILLEVTELCVTELSATTLDCSELSELPGDTLTL